MVKPAARSILAVTYRFDGLSSTTRIVALALASIVRGLLAGCEVPRRFRRVRSRHSHGNRQGKRRTNAQFALDRDVATEQFGELLAQGQAEPRTAQPLLDRRFDLDEVVEQHGLVLGG